MMEKMDGKDFDQLVRFFDGMAQTSWLSSIHDQLKKATGNWSNLEVLDVGCGTGRILLRGVNEASHVTGIDLSEQMVKACQTLFSQHNVDDKASFIVGDAYKLPFKNEQFDIAISTCVLFLLPKPEIGMEEIIRVVKKSGRIVMLNPSLKMNPLEATRYCEENNITGFEQKTLIQWSTISTSRHRYSKEQLTNFFLEKEAKSVEHLEVLDGLAMITIARF